MCAHESVCVYVHTCVYNKTCCLYLNENRKFYHLHADDRLLAFCTVYKNDGYSTGPGNECCVLSTLQLSCADGLEPG